MAAVGALQGNNLPTNQAGSGPYINPGMQSPVMPQRPSIGSQAPPQYNTMPGVAPVQNGSQNSTVMGGGAQNQVRATGPTAGFDPSYLQNLATSDAGAFSRPSGGLAFNPLGNLTGLPGQGVSGGGNAPVPGMPQGMLTQALAANPTFQPGAAGGAAGTATQNTIAQMLQNVFGSQGLFGTQAGAPSTGGFQL
jgi:hypothetical protein